MIDVETFKSCGLVATFLGALLEGEVSMLTSVIGSRMGYYNLGFALFLGFLGAWIADWFKYIVGRTKGQKLLKNKPKLKAKFDKASIWFDKHPFMLLTFYKLMFGMTTVILVMAGVKGISYARFALHTAISILLWISLLGGVGYFCAETMISNFNFVSDHKLEFFGVMASLIFMYWFFGKRPYRKECFDCGK